MSQQLTHCWQTAALSWQKVKEESTAAKYKGLPPGGLDNIRTT